MYWETLGSDDHRKNLEFTLKHSYAKSYHETYQDLGQFTFTFKEFEIDVICVKPRSLVEDAKHCFLTKRNMHCALNWTPVDIANSLKNVFFEAYGEYLVGPLSVPMVLVHFKTDKLYSY